MCNVLIVGEVLMCYVNTLSSKKKYRKTNLIKKPLWKVNDEGDFDECGFLMKLVFDESGF